MILAKIIKIDQNSHNLDRITMFRTFALISFLRGKVGVSLISTDLVSVDNPGWPVVGT